MCKYSAVPRSRGVEQALGRVLAKMPSLRLKRLKKRTCVEGGCAICRLGWSRKGAPAETENISTCAGMFPAFDKIGTLSCKILDNNTARLDNQTIGSVIALEIETIILIFVTLDLCWGTWPVALKLAAF